MTRVTSSIFTLLVLTSSAFAQMEAPKPAAELGKLDMFVGFWTLEGDMSAHSPGGGGKTIQHEKCEWMQGGFFLECRKQVRGPMGDNVRLTLIGYSDNEKAFTWRDFDALGEFQDSRGRIDGNTFIWSGEANMLRTKTKGRYTVKITSPTTFDYAFEISSDGKSWNTILQGKATKTKYPAF